MEKTYEFVAMHIKIALIYTHFIKMGWRYRESIVPKDLLRTSNFLLFERNKETNMEYLLIDEKHVFKYIDDLEETCETTTKAMASPTPLTHKETMLVALLSVYLDEYSFDTFKKVLKVLNEVVKEGANEPNKASE